MLNIDEGIIAVNFARSVVEQHVRNSSIPSKDLNGIFNEKLGAFVTIHTYSNHNLRGCIGIPLPIMSLKEAIVEGAKSVTRDPRFPPTRNQRIPNAVKELNYVSTTLSPARSPRLVGNTDGQRTRKYVLVQRELDKSTLPLRDLACLW